MSSTVRSKLVEHYIEELAALRTDNAQLQAQNKELQAELEAAKNELSRLHRLTANYGPPGPPDPPRPLIRKDYG